MMFSVGHYFTKLLEGAWNLKIAVNSLLMNIHDFLIMIFVKL